ncbi:UbiA prenyltransferase family [Stachybotrys elegans]|uniref:UbiA prenyltransferase family n=1 Tax=Stachybotrys elegans TaxID=80388 RepID=A0A8K0SLT4_9HYPO|nr:UbiA prenyltransferase family [Stachybotrys elegans]
MATATVTKTTVLTKDVTFSLVVWGFIQDDVYGFVIPSTLFGVLGALASGAALSEKAPLAAEVLARVPLVLAFNLVNILIFDMSNQRAPESVEEDRVNKPWRPIPSGRITTEQTRRGLLFVLPVAIALNYMLGVHADALLLLTFCWYYNDIKGNDEVCRDVVIAICYTLCNKISLQIAIGTDNAISANGYAWIATISAVALSTMHAQDLKDQEGDALRGRWTLPLFLGDEAARAIVSLLVPAWSFACALFWGNGHYWVSLPFGLYLARRVWMKRTPRDDKKSWKLWCLWHMTLFALPLLGGGAGAV